MASRSWNSAQSSRSTNSLMGKVMARNHRGCIGTSFCSMLKPFSRRSFPSMHCTLPQGNALLSSSSHTYSAKTRARKREGPPPALLLCGSTSAAAAATKASCSGAILRPSKRRRVPMRPRLSTGSGAEASEYRKSERALSQRVLGTDGKMRLTETRR